MSWLIRIAWTLRLRPVISKCFCFFTQYGGDSVLFLRRTGTFDTFWLACRFLDYSNSSSRMKDFSLSSSVDDKALFLATLTCFFRASNALIVDYLPIVKSTLSKLVSWSWASGDFDFEPSWTLLNLRKLSSSKISFCSRFYAWLNSTRKDSFSVLKILKNDYFEST